jgi:hypothetical protein
MSDGLISENTQCNSIKRSTGLYKKHRRKASVLAYVSQT